MSDFNDMEMLRADAFEAGKHEERETLLVEVWKQWDGCYSVSKGYDTETFNLWLRQRYFDAFGKWPM